MSPRWFLTLAAASVLVVSACGDDDTSTDDTGSGAGPGSTETVSTDPVEASLEISPDVREHGVVITWTLTNPGDRELVVFDDRRADEPEDAQRLDAFVAGRDEDVVEVARRLFPLSEDVEMEARPQLAASSLAPGSSLSGKDFVSLPFEYNTVGADGEGGGPPPPENPSQAVFCVGVAAAEHFPPSTVDGKQVRSVEHNPANAALQTLVCSDPFDVPA